MDLFKLVGRIAIENAEANKALEETSNEAKKTHSKMSKFFSGVGKGAAAVGKAVGKGLLAAGGAMGALTVKAMNMGGELEQNMGGSEAVFKEYATKMQVIADDAFSNMGLSTSDFLATANKMGALFQGAGFSIQESSDLSAKAMQRAADVASIMGIDTASAMEAVAGAAKGNFTMMDNLGVAMNDTTLNAYAMEKGLKKTTKEMTNQEKIGLAMELFLEKTAYAAGNYKKENETLAGSLSTAKAALTNFLDGSGDVDQLVDAFSHAADVIIGNIQEIAPRLISGLSEILSKVIPMINPLVQKLLPVVVEGAVSILNGLVEATPELVDILVNDVLPDLLVGFTDIVNSLTEALPSLMQTICSALPTLLPMLIDAVCSMLLTLVENIDGIIQPIIDCLPDVIISVIDALLANLPALIEGVITLVLGIVEKLPTIIQNLVEAIPTVIDMLTESLLDNLPMLVEGIIALVMGIVEALPQIIHVLCEAAPTIIGSIVDSLMVAIPALLEAGGNLLMGLLEGMIEGIKDIPAILKDVWNSIVGGLKALFGIHSPSTVMADLGGNIMEGLINGIRNLLGRCTAAMKAVWSGIKNVFSNVGGWFRDKFNAAKNSVKNVWSGVKNIFSNVWSGIKGVFGNVAGWFREKFQAAKNGIMNIWKSIKLKLPDIKMPHFKVSGKFSLNPIQVPKLSIDWYAKAMDDPMLLTDPTIFGFNASTGKLLGGGEAGDEVVSGKDALMDMIGQVVDSRTAAQNDRMIGVLTAILDAIVGGNRDAVQAIMADKTFKVGEREFGRLVREYA